MSEVQEIKQENKQLKVVYDNLNRLIKEKKDAMPKGFNKTRFVQNCMTVLQDTKDIEKCEPISIARTMLKGAFLGLDFFNQECYAIVYNENKGTKDNPVWVKSVKFQTDYKGERKLVQKYSVRPIVSLYSKVVRVGDEFSEEIQAGKQIINFKPLPFNNGDIVGAFAVVIYKDGDMIYEAMSKEEIEHIRKTYSKAAESGAWKNTPGEMYRKTVIRRLCKNIELQFDSIEQAQAFEDASDVDFDKEVQPEKSKQATVIDAAFEVIADEANEG